MKSNQQSAAAAPALPAAARGRGAPGDAFAAFAPVERGTLQSQAYVQLREALRAGRFAPGTSITLRAAAEALGTSPMPVRGALQRLENEGALMATGAKRTLSIPELDDQALLELRDIRVQLEGFAAARAAKSATEADIAEIDGHADAMEAAARAGDVAGYMLANWAFHSAVYRASRMPQLLAIVETLWLRIGPYVHLMMPDVQHMIDSMPRHREVVAGLLARDADAARRAITADITESAVELLRAVGTGRKRRSAP
jgi:DNA-binding GntR family transcriptional regulator